ncbi:MAG: hypothetical protein ACHREM_02160, partial [Polyangiales bacterium]
MTRGARQIAIVAGASALGLAMSCGRSAPPPGDSVATTMTTTTAMTTATTTATAMTTATTSASASAAPLLLGAKGELTWIYAEARAGSPKLGYLRSGATVERDDKPTGDDGCKHGWYAVKPLG